MQAVASEPGGPVTDEDLDAVAAVEHVDPHRVLGLHADPAGGFVLRAFRPDALSVEVVPSGGALPRRAMTRVRGEGLFETRYPEARAAFPYEIDVRYPNDTFTVRDAYAFPPSLGNLDLHLAAEGTHLEAWRHFGAHVRAANGVSGVGFTVWAPTARRVSVCGDFNAWDGRLHAMRRLGTGIWEIFIPDVGDGALYKYEILTAEGVLVLKTDPYAQAMELRPNTASRVVVRKHQFGDAKWIGDRAVTDLRKRPLAIYEVHLASWKKKDGRWMTYRELADELVDYVVDLGFTHLELLPVMEHPFDGSWGYQVSGYYAPTSRFGTPDDFRYFVDRCHQKGLGVLMDWVPAHFPKDAFALGRFDGTALYEHLDPRQGEHREWNTYVFNYGRPEVKNFLVANALYWIEEFHVDGFRVDAVASMLHLDYGANDPSEWVPNEHGGRENLEAVAFVRDLNDAVHQRFPGVIVCAEESTTWPGVTKPTYLGGLGFDFKWNMGWMHDTLDYIKSDPIYRSFNHRFVTFGLMYAFSEAFILPLSHDEVVHLKKSLLSKVPGNRWQMHATLRALYAMMWTHPGKKLLFMGGELGQYAEWNHEAQLAWELLGEPDHRGLQQLLRDANRIYKEHPALWELDGDPDGFRWIDANDAAQSVASYIRWPKERAAPKPKPRKAPDPKSPPPYRPVPSTTGKHVVFVGNFTPIVRHGYRLGVPRKGRYLEVLNTDATVYGGSGVGNLGSVAVEDVPSHGHAQSIVVSLPPLGALWLVPDREDDASS